MTLMTWVVAVVNSGYAAPTIWTGPNTNFAQTAIVNPPQADVLIPGKVTLARNFNHALYNTNVDIDPFTQQPGAIPGCPSDTEWAFGTLNNFASLSYQSFYSLRDLDLSSLLVTTPPSPMVCHIINEDIYFSITFSAWPHGGGMIAYTRSTPAVVSSPPPTVSITNPAPNAVFAAPANVKIAASAAVTTGTVTNVAFFGNNSPLGSRQSVPFNLIASNLTAGSYNLAAVATAAGISTTSSVVTVSVVSPVVTSLSAPAAADNQLSFGFSADQGLSYVVESSSNLFDWTPVITNVATGGTILFTNDISGDEKFFRVGRQPNP